MSLNQSIIFLLLTGFLSISLNCKPTIDERIHGAGSVGYFKNGQDFDARKNPTPTPSNPSPSVTPNVNDPTVPSPTVTPSVTPLPPNNPQMKVVQTFVSDEYRPVDIIVTFDTSGSMKEEKAALEANLKDFLYKMLDRKVNLKLFVLGHEMSFPQGLSSLVYVNYPVGSHNSLSYLKKFFDSNPSLRLNSGLEVIFISDDNATTVGGNLVAKDMSLQYKDGRAIRFNGLVGLKVGTITPNCVVNAIGTEYQALATATKGVIYDICSNDWSSLLKQIGDNITLENKIFQLIEAPDEKSEILVKLDGAVLAKDKYTINFEQKTLKIVESELMKERMNIEILYYKK